MNFKSFLIVAIALVMLFAVGCSSGKIVTPEGDAFQTSGEKAHADWGSYELYFNPGTGDTSIIYDRESSGHIDVTAWLEPPACGGPGCVAATLVGWNPATNVATFNVTITNPTPWAASDIRMIFYKLGGKDIVNADSYTKSFMTSIQPFIAYAKALPNRLFPGAGAVTETIQIYWPPMSSFSIYFKVSAWLWLNCQDPYEINGMFQNGKLTPGGGNATIGCNVLDWQNNVNSVSIDTTPITGGVTNLANVAGNLWQANITNSLGAGVGNYRCLITAKSPNPQNYDLYNYLVIVISPPAWTPTLTWQLPPGPCTLDFGVISAPPMQEGHALVAHVDIQGQCSEIWRYPGWNNPPVFYASLRNLDPTNPNFQPWPPVRIDAALDGAFGWTNFNTMQWLEDPWVANLNTYCNMTNAPLFISNPQFDDHRHYFIFPDAFALQAIECCDSFDTVQCALYADLTGGLLGFHGIPGRMEGFDYTDQDIIWEAPFPFAFIGDGPGKVDPADIVGMDTMMGKEDDTIILYIAERVHWEIEVFSIQDIGPGPVDIVNWIMTIPVMEITGIPACPVDLELLPGNDKYLPCPGIPIICVLIDNAQPPFPPPGFGGTILIYDALTGALVDQIGDGVNPGVNNTPAFIDTEDKGFAIHVMQQGPAVTVFKFI